MLSSHLQRFTLAASGAYTESWPQGRVWGGLCEGEVCRAFGGACGPTVGIHRRCTPRGSWVGFLMVYKVVSRNCVPLIHFVLSPGCCFPNLSLPLSHAILNSVFWMGWERGGSLWQHPTPWGSQVLTHSHYPPWEKSWAKKSLLALSCDTLEEGWCKQSETAPVILRNARILGCFCSSGVLKLPCWTRRLPQRHYWP